MVSDVGGVRVEIVNSPFCHPRLEMECGYSLRKRLDDADMAGAPAHVAGDYPEWLEPHFKRAFGDARAEEGAALSSRAPLDLRVNTLKRSEEHTSELQSL